MQKIILSVSNDISTDQRVKKIATFLYEKGYNVTIIGRNLNDIKIIETGFQVYRFNLWFNRGFLFYAELNIKLFFKLLLSKKTILYANDLDTLLPNYLVSIIQNKKLIYDSHEIFTEVPELIHRSRVKQIWLTIEKSIFPKLKKIITVNNKIAAYYSNKYNVQVNVVRNLSPKITTINKPNSISNSIKNNKKMLILQGSGINKDRGAEEAVLMMKFLENCILFIIGSGDVIEDLKLLIQKNNLHDKVKLIPRMPYEELLKYTILADFGLTLDKGTNLNYEYSLPNKLFDYIQTNTPIIASNRELVANIVNEHNIGIVLNTFNPKKMAEVIQNIVNDESLQSLWKDNIEQIKDQYCWENEVKKIDEILENIH